MTVTASAISLCTTAWVGGIAVSAAGYALDLQVPWVGGALVAGLASFGGAFLWGRSYEAARIERNLR